MVLFGRESVDFDQWVERKRDRLARAPTAALEELANQATQRRERQAAVQWWRRLAEQDPYSTGVTGHVMEALEAAGDRAGALEHAERHAARMREDLTAADVRARR